VDGKGWDYRETEPPPSHQAKVEARFIAERRAEAKGHVPAEGTSKEFAEVAKSAGLSAADAVKLTKLFR
jgi:hypothetical protein